MSPKEEFRATGEAVLTAGEFSIAPSAGDLTAVRHFDHLSSDFVMQETGNPKLPGQGYRVYRKRKESMRVEIPHRLIIQYLVVLFVAVGCASVVDQVKMNKFADTSKAYGEKLLWGHFEAANLYRKPELAENDKPDFEKLKNIKVAQYDIKDMNVSDDGSRIDQDAEITYFHRDKMILKTLRDEQVWEFDAKDRRWYLTTQLPTFP